MPEVRILSQATLALAASTLAFRSLPFALWALFSKRLRVKDRVSCVIAWLAFAGFLLRDHETAIVFAVAVAGFCYFAVASIGVQFLAARFARSEASRDSVLLSCLIAFLLLPGIVVPYPYNVLLLVPGFEIFFSAYSYTVECAKQGIPSFRSALFFLLIDPTLVYVDRAKPVSGPGLSEAGFRRCCLGALTVYAYYLLLPYSGEFPSRISTWPEAGRAWFALGTLSMGLYAIHSGVASFQIGIMRLAGYSVPERYRLAFLATSPEEFWRRWNTYLGDWLKRYVFSPSALLIGRHVRSKVAGLHVALAIVVTFVACGAVHELVQWLSVGRASGAAIAGFTLHGLLLLVWLQSSRSLRAMGWGGGTKAKGAARIVSLLLVQQWFLVSGWLLLPALSGQGVSNSLRQAIARLFGAT